MNRVPANASAKHITFAVHSRFVDRGDCARKKQHLLFNFVNCFIRKEFGVILHEKNQSAGLRKGMPMTNSGETGVLENPNRRVKVYVLGGDGQWDDRGTGYVSCELLPVSGRSSYLASKLCAAMLNQHIHKNFDLHFGLR